MLKLTRFIGSLFRRYPDDARAIEISRLLDADSNMKKDDDCQSSYVVAVQGPHDPLYFGLFSAIMADLHKKLPVEGHLLLVSSINGAMGVGWSQTLMRSLPIRWLICSQWARINRKLIGHIGYRSVSFNYPVGDLLDWIRAGKLWGKMKSKDSFSDLSANGVLIGDLVIDSYLRFRPSPRFKVEDSFVRYIIWQALRDLRRASRFFQLKKPNLYLSSYSTYVEHGVAVRVALKYGVPVRVYGNLNVFGKKLSENDFYHTADTSDYSKKFDNLEGKVEAIRLAEQALKFRLDGGVDLATNYMKKSAYIQTEEQVPNVSGSVVVFLHDFYDSPHVYSNLIFTDFWEWIIFTIETLDSSRIKFFIKPHPNQISLSDAAFKELLNLYPNINVISPRVTNKQLAEAGMLCGVTAYGTVAHELAFFGIPSIGCAKHPHNSFEFCSTAHDIREYKLLLEAAGSNSLSAIEMREQALRFFYMHNLFGTDYDLQLRELLVKYSKQFDKSDSKFDSNCLIGLRQSSGWINHIEKICDELKINKKSKESLDAQ